MSGGNQNGNNDTVHFGVFDADLRTHELRKHGTRVKLPRQSFQILQMLLSRPGELVTREELQNALWPADTFVDFDHGVNNAVKRIRAVLGDSAEAPHWIETLPRLGYRFIGPVEAPSNGHSSTNGTNGTLNHATAIATPLIPDAPSRRTIKWWLWAGSAGLLLLVALGAFRRLHLSGSTDSLRIVPFTSYPGFEFAPTFSPDGNQIAFSWTGEEPSEGFDLYVKVVGTETPVPLTHNPSTFLIPAWSPDGRFIAFSRLKRGSPADSGIFVIPSVGGTEIKLADLNTQKHMFEGGIAWGPDSQSLIYTDSADGEFASRLALVNIQTRERRTLARPGPRCTGMGLAQFSPDGRALASACVITFGLGELYVQPWPTGQPRRILAAKGDFEGVTWSEDGRSLIYALGRNLWRIQARGGTPERLWFGQGALTPSVARTGSRMAFTHAEKSIDLWKVPMGEAARNTAPARLVPSNLAQQNPRYSPDGSKIAFESTRSGNPEVWVCDADGSHLVQLTSFGGPLTGTPNWSPDGKQIVFDSRASGRPELYIIDAQGGKPRLFPTNPGGGSIPYWSHDGQWIYYSSEDPSGASQLFKIRVDGGKALRLTSESGFISQESVDGKRLYYSRLSESTELWSVSTEGGDERRVEGLPTFAWPAWDVTPTGIYYFDSIQPDSTVLFYDFRTKRSTKAVKLVGSPAPFVMGLSVAPDGSNLLYSREDRAIADIELVEGFR
jgi:Tol biopolymer transport system component/DNA-binding winged helix-turn-helix (wHTH) protein